MKKLIYSVILFFSSVAMACPNCSGSDNAVDKYTVVILGVFILLTYIPFYLFFKFCRKYSNVNESPAVEVNLDDL